MTDLKTMSPIELDSYLRMKGLLHDGVVSLRRRSDHVVNIVIEDVNSAFAGLPEYRGPVPCIIRLEGMVVHEDVSDLRSFHVYEAEIERDVEGNVTNRLSLTFWPAGRPRLALRHASVTEGGALGLDNDSFGG